MSHQAVRVLLVEDNPDDVLLLRAMFRKETPGSFEFTHLTCISDAEAHLAESAVDIILLDLGLPDRQGIDVVTWAREAAPDVPLLVLTGLDDETLAGGAMKAGAQDYLIKGQVENRALPRALRYAIERHGMQREAESIRKQQLQLKDDFLSHVSHELRSPLTAIYQFVTIIADGLAGETNPEQTEYLNVILRNIKQLQAMIDDLLEVTRVRAGKLGVEPRYMLVADTVDYAVATLQEAAKTKGLALCLDLPASPLTVHADPTRIRQILLILCDNAIKFTPPGGTVTLRARSFAQDPRLVLLEVADDGCGISPDLGESVFERLYQAADHPEGPRKGLGLGLHIAKELVVRQGGRIWVTSEPGRGATFSFTLPVQPQSCLPIPLGGSLDTCTLLTVEICPRDRSLAGAQRHAWSCEARDRLKRFLRHEQDLVLPDTASAGPREVFFVLAFADAQGAMALARRVQEQFAPTQLLEQDSTVTVSCRLLHSIPLTAHQVTESGIEQITAQVAGYLKAVTAVRRM